MNFCRGCNHNFAGVHAFDLHRVGSFRANARGCLTEVEMHDKGFTTTTATASLIVGGKRTTQALETWHEPMSEEQKARFNRLNIEREEVA